MQTLKVVLGSMAFFLCLWLTTGLLGDALLGATAQECVQNARASGLRGRPPRTEDVLEAVCLVNGEAGFSAFLPGMSSFRLPAPEPLTQPRSGSAAG